MYYTLSVIGSGGSITFVGCHGPDITGPSTGPDSLSPGPGPDIALKLEMIYHQQCHEYYLFNCFMVIEV